MQDNPTYLYPLNNDYDPDGFIDGRSFALVDGPSHGTLRVDPATGQYLYTPGAGYLGPDRFTYTVDDNEGATSNVATVSIAVSPNQPPVAGDDAITVVELTPTGLNALFDNDTDPDGFVDRFSFDLVEAPTHGVVTTTTFGSPLYTPAVGYLGPDYFTYSVRDNSGATSNVASVSVTVVPNQPPVAGDDAFTMVAGTTLGLYDAYFNDSDPDGFVQFASFALVDSPIHGTFTIDPASGYPSYKPDAGYAGPDSLTYTVRDDLGAISNVATISITVLPNQPPIAGDDAVDVVEGTSTRLGSIFFNDSDPDGYADATTFALVNPPTHGTLAFDPINGAPEYMPKAGYLGPDHFTYTVRDLSGASSNVAAVSITVVANRPPTAGDDDIQAVQGALTHLIPILFNDFDPDGSLDFSSFHLVDAPAHGTITNDPSTGLLYTSAAGYVGPDRFTYTINDNSGSTSNVAAVSITVVPNQSPTAGDDVVQVKEKTTADLSQIFFNDSDPDGLLNLLSFRVVDAPSHGTIRFDPAIGFVYRPTAGYLGPDHFTYKVKDDSGATSNVASVSIAVVANRPPTARDDGGSTQAGLPVKFTVLDNDDDPDGTLTRSTVAIASAPAHGTALVDPAYGRITYIPAPGFSGIETFTYTVKDDNGAVSNPATVTVIVASVQPVVSDVEVLFGSKSYSLLGNARNLPWTDITAVRVTYATDLPVTMGDLRLSGFFMTYTFTGFRYDPSTRTAVWTLASPVGADQVGLSLDSRPSVAGPDFATVFGVLPGDFDADGVVTIRDSVGIRGHTPRVGDYSIFADLDGDGDVDLDDINAPRRRLGTINAPR